MNKPNGKATAIPIASPADRITQIQEAVASSFKLDPYVKITLKGKEYTLEFNNTAAKGVYKDTGFNPISDALNFERWVDPEFIGAVLYHGLKCHHPDMTQEVADNLITMRQGLYIRDTLIKALTTPLPDIPDDYVPDKESPIEIVTDPMQPPVPSG